MPSKKLSANWTPERRARENANQRAARARKRLGYAPAIERGDCVVARGPMGNPPEPMLGEGLALKGQSISRDADGALRQVWDLGREGGNPNPEPIPADFARTTISRARTPTGEIIRWERYEREAADRHAALMAAWDRHAERYAGLVAPTPAPEISDAQTVTAYPIGDHHHGLLAWAPEAGEHWDHKYSEASLDIATSELVRMAPPSELAIIVNLGDMKHAQDDAQVTPGHGNKLDVDGRSAKLADLLLGMLTNMIGRALQKHKCVRFRNLPGNHDPHVAAALARELRAWYRNEPRVEIMPAHAAHQYDRFGKVLLGYHHGDRTPGSELAAIMAVDQREAWGECKYCHWLCGHVHHKIRDKEHPGCTVETFNILPPGDAWHAGRYRASRSMQAITYDLEYGEISRAVVGYERIRAEVERRARR